MPHPQFYSVSRLFCSDKGLLLTILNLSIRLLLALVVVGWGGSPNDNFAEKKTRVIDKNERWIFNLDLTLLTYVE